MIMRAMALSRAETSTAENNKTNYTKYNYSRATKAHILQNIFGRHSLRNFVDIVDGDYSVTDNCPILREDIDAIENIFGTNLGSLKGK